MNHTLKIMAWNSNGLLKHQQELKVVLDTENIDVCLISESHFTKQSFIKLKGYKIYHALHPNNTARGGSTIIIKENIYHYEEMKIEEPGIQAVGICIKTKRYPIILSAIYCPPRYKLKEEHYLRLLKQLGDRFILGGDFNAKNTFWGSRLTTTKGRELYKAIKDTKCDVASTGKPTYWPTDPQKIPDLIDFFIYKNINKNYIDIQEGFDMSSDHSSIMLTISERIIIKQSTPTLVNKSTDWESFRISLEKRIELNVPLRNTEQFEQEVAQFVKDIQRSAWENTNEPNIRRRGNHYPKEIRNLITEKRSQRKKWHQTRAPEDKRLLNNLTKKLTKLIKSYNDESFNEYLQGLTSDSSTEYSLWKATKKMKKSTTQIPPIREENGRWAINNEQKAKRFAQHLEKIFQPNEGQTYDLPENATPDDMNIKLTTPKEVFNEIKNNISTKKSPGYDLITGEILHHLPRKGLVKITNLINAAFRLKYVPSLWKVAEVIMIAKPGKPCHDTTSYRPISLLPVISKLFEKLLIKRLKPILEQKNLIPDYQFGFREKHSTIDQIHRISNVIEKALEERKVCSTIFLDVAQAFDKVWHIGLTYKLRKMLPKQYADILESYISNRVFRVRQEDGYSQLKEIQAGVPQGSVLGPVLYLLYTCDIPEVEDITIATFADDTAIMAIEESHEAATEKVQLAINKVLVWTKKWRIKLNETKSIHIDFTNKKEQHFPVYINNQQIPYANTAKYLGMSLDAKLRWKAHVKKKRAELELRYKKMYWLLGRLSPLAVHNKLLLYKQVLMPVWTYGIQLWGCTKKSNMKIIQRFQNKVLRDIVNAPWYIRNDDLHKDLKMDTVAKVTQKYAEAHEHRLHHHVNVEAIQLLDNTDKLRRLKRTKPFELV